MNEAQENWFYQENGQRMGPVTENEMVQLINQSIIFRHTPVWKQGYTDWINIADTDLRIHLSNNPPPLSGAQINNSIVWILAFAPLIGYFLEWFFAGMVGGSEYAAELAMDNNKYWFITLVLNIALSIFDEKQLEKAGHSTDKFKGFVWLVPVYLYQRAEATKQNLAYFIVWIACIVLVLFA